MSVEEFIAKADEFAAGIGGGRFYKRSVLSIRKGAGVLEEVFGGGVYKHCLEIGTYRGVSAAFIATMCPRVTTVDLYRGRVEDTDGSERRREFWEYMGVSSRITQILVNGDWEKQSKFADLDFDIAFIDGGKINVATDFNLVNRCGVVLFHDYDDRGRVDDYVFKFVNTLPRDEVTKMDIFALWRRL